MKNSRKGVPVYIRYADCRLFDEHENVIDHAKAAPGMMRVLVWELIPSPSDQALDFGDFATLDEAVKTIGDPYGPDKTIYYVYNPKGRLILEKRYCEIEDMAQGGKNSLKSIDPEEVQKGAPAVVSG